MCNEALSEIMGGEGPGRGTQMRIRVELRSRLQLLFFRLLFGIRRRFLRLSRCFLRFQRLFHLHGIVTVNGGEVVLHGDCLKPHLFTGIRKLICCFQTPVIALQVIAEKHVSFSSVLQHILGHRQIA